MNVNAISVLFFPLPRQKARYLSLRDPIVFKKDGNLPFGFLIAENDDAQYSSKY